jgi:hypothetical protein
MNSKEAEAVITAARVLGHKAFTLLSTAKSNDRFNYAVRFEISDYTTRLVTTRLVTTSAADAFLFILNNKP